MKGLLRPRRRWLQFSLGSLLILITIICVALGPRVNRAHLQSRAAARIEALGGHVRYDYERLGQREPDGPAWLRKWLGVDYFARIVEVGMSNKEVGDDELAFLGDLPDLERLRLSRTEAGDRGLPYLKHLTKLRCLQLDRTKVDDAAKDNFTNLSSLQYLFLKDTKLSDVGLKSMEPLGDLKVIDLSRTSVTDGCIDDLNKHPKLLFAGLRDTKVTQAGRERLKAFSVLGDDPPQGDHAAAALAELTELDFKNQPLADIKEYLAERHDIGIVLDPKAFSTVPAGADVSITSSITHKSLGESLDEMLRPLGLTYDIRHDVVYITKAPARPAFYSRALRDRATLPSPVQAALLQPAVLDYTDFPLTDAIEYFREKYQLELVNLQLDRAAWVESRIGTDSPITGTYGKLPLRSLLELMFAEFDLTCDFHHEALLVRPITAPPPDTVAALEPGADLPDSICAALAKKADCNVDDVTLAQFIDFLRDSYGLEIRLDTAALNAARRSADEPLHGTYRDISIRSLLALALEQLGLTCDVEGETLVVRPRSIK